MTARAYNLACGAALLALVACAQSPNASRSDNGAVCRSSGDAYARTDLYFGLARAHGVVSDAEFQSFVERAVTPRFPEGLTLLNGSGQFRDAGGVTQAEGSKVLILLYPRRDVSADQRIDAIRADYRQRFAQRSVLRADSLWCVSF